MTEISDFDKGRLEILGKIYTSVNAEDEPIEKLERILSQSITILLLLHKKYGWGVPRK